MLVSKQKVNIIKKKRGESYFFSTPGASFGDSDGFSGIVWVLNRSLIVSFGAPGAGGLMSVLKPIRFAVITTRSSIRISSLRSSLPSWRLRLQNGHVLISTSAPVALVHAVLCDGQGKIRKTSFHTFTCTTASLFIAIPFHFDKLEARHTH